jgi:hypothetical protein
MENEGKSMTILGMLLVLAGAALLVALIWSFARERTSNTDNSNQGGQGAVN